MRPQSEGIDLSKIKRMTNLLKVIILYFVSIGPALGQIEITRQVISPWGTSSQSGSVQMDATLGEVFIGSTKGGLVLTQGFHQPEGKIITALTEYKGEALNYSIYPNPFLHQIFIEISTPAIKPGMLEIYSLDGRMIKRIDSQAFSGPLQIDLEFLVAGTYAIRLLDQEMKTIFHHIIQKG